MLRRKIYEKLLEWKNRKDKECLLVTGARQVGKTFIIEQFGKENYESYIYINFYKEPEQKKIFEDSLSAQEIYRKISLYVNEVNFIPGKTLIFLDEIQECPNARTALKFLALDNKYDVIASGSLLGIHYKEIASIPVGYERHMEMYSLDFEEFLWAMGKTEQAIFYLKEYFDKTEKVPYGINDQFLLLLRQYSVVGGMPEAVNSFIKSNNYQYVYDIQKKIIESYRFDIEKYASIPDRQKISDCYFSIPRQLAKENTKFQYKVVTRDGSGRKYANSLNWLVDAGLIKFCYNVSTPSFPIIAYEKSDQYKVYASDIGILTAMYGFETQAALLKNTLTGPVKGGIYENLIADILIKKGLNLNYYKNDNNTQEIEFLLNMDSQVIPVEVKSANGASISLNNFIEQFKPVRAYKFITGNVGIKDTKITLPLYMAMFLPSKN